jgi:predicted nucleic acid-binding protein
MILIDTGPLVAIHDHEDAFHNECVESFSAFKDQPAATTWACFAEAIYLLGEGGGFRFQARIWESWRSGLLQLVDLIQDEISHAHLLMDRYQDHPVDLADATLVAVADERGWRTVFTLDTHFFAYRLLDGSSLDVVLPTKH